MMTCDEFQRAMHAYLDRGLAEEAAREVQAHAQACVACGRELRELERLRGWLAQSAVERAPESARDRVRRALHEAVELEAERVRAQPPAIMTLWEVAEYLRVGEPEARRIAYGIPHFQIAGQLRFRREMVERWIETQERQAAGTSGPALTLLSDEKTVWALVG